MTLRLNHAGAALLVAVAVLTRFVGLGARSFHHDEAIHAWLAHELFQGRGYHYDPVYHGPLLYHLESVVFHLAGPGEFQARIVSAVFGVLLVVALYLVVKPHLGRAVASVAGVLAIASPAITYYSRFNSHDSLIAAFTVVMIGAPFFYRGTGLMWLAVALGLAISTKLNAYFIVASLALYVACYAAYCRARRHPLPFIGFARANGVYLAMAAGLLATIVVLLSAATFQYFIVSAGLTPFAALGTTIRSVLLGGFEYWTSIQRAPRLGGSFLFYLPILVIYEPLIVSAALGALVYYMERRAVFAALLFGGVAVEWMALSYVAPIHGLFSGGGPIEPWHVLLASAWLLAGAWTVVSLWNAQRTFLACWVFVGVMQFLLYSYANEKVPWLAIHVLLPWLVVTAAFIVDLWQEGNRAGRVAGRGAVVMAVALELMSARASWIVNTRNRSNVAEPLLQIHYAEGVDRAVGLVRDLAGVAGTGAVAKIQSAVQWPFVWYLRDARREYTGEPFSPRETAPLLIAAEGPLPQELAGSYVPMTLDYYSWTTWAARARQGDVAGLLRFALRHDRWGQEQSLRFVVWIRKDLAPGRAASR